MLWILYLAWFTSLISDNILLNSFRYKTSLNKLNILSVFKLALSFPDDTLKSCVNLQLQISSKNLVLIIYFLHKKVTGIFLNILQA